MKKAATIIIAVMALFFAVSCTQTEHFGYVSFDGRAKDIIASIAYPTPESQVWTVTATRIDNGSKTGEGTYNDILLTDVLGPFSVGRWSFAFESENYGGTTTVRIGEGENHVEATVAPKGGTGTLLFTGCNIEPTSNDFLFISVDGEKRASFAVERFEARRDGRLSVTDKEIELEAGLHEITVTVEAKDTQTLESFMVRVEPGLVTTVSFGTFEGQAFLEINVETHEAVEH